MSYVKHPAWKVEAARALKDDGLTVTEISHELLVGTDTVRMWLNPEAYEGHKMRQRHYDALAARGPRPCRKFGWPTFTRAVALWERGDSYTAIANALAVYEQIDVCPETVRAVLREHHPGWTTRPRGAAFGSENGNRPRVAA